MDNNLVPLNGRTAEDHRHLFTEEIVVLLHLLKKTQEEASVTSTAVTTSMYEALEGYLYKLDHKLFIYAVLYYCEMYSVGEEKELKFRIPQKAALMARGHLKRTAHCVLSVAFHDLARFVDAKYLSIMSNRAGPRKVSNIKRRKLSGRDKLKRLILSKAKTVLKISDITNTHHRLVKPL